MIDTSEKLNREMDSSVLYQRTDNPNVPCLENRVAYQWQSEGDLLGHRHSARRNKVVLTWLATALNGASDPRAYLDVGCAYGNHLLMLNTMLHKQNVQMTGVDLYEDGLAFAKEFARVIPGYENCHFRAANLAAGLPFDDNTFDAINLSDVLEHMDQPDQALRELIRVAKPGATIVISTPLRGSIFKSAAKFANSLMKGRLYKDYYKGKNTELDERGQPVMSTLAGNDHVSEMTYRQLMDLVRSVGLNVEEAHLMSIFSGSSFFDRHLVLMAGILVLEAIHDLLKAPSWAHSVCLKLRAPAA
jgi:SAM-dependent methyltransferase